MYHYQRALASLLAMFLFVAMPASAAVPDDVARLQQEWERIKYQVAPAEQEARLERLTNDAAAVAARSPAAPEVLIWQAIIESTYAGAKGGLGALSHVKAAKKALEQAIAIHPEALDGSALTSLGSLYYQVPGWPIGFGDDKKAAEFLKRGMAVNPTGIDSNYFYGDFMLRKGDLDSAEKYLRKALQAPARPGRAIADEGRRREIQQLLDKIANARK